VSCKWVGLFTIATVGLSTIHRLWTLLGDLKLTPTAFVRHFVARAICLIVIPILFYMFMFQIHFLILGSSGDGDGFMSSEFQQTLGGRHMEDTYAGQTQPAMITPK
jgi:dolichyl-phosphate-mannose-protein mannosyltransferase